MASSTSSPVSPFEINQISSTVTTEEAASFYQAHGVFYQEDPEIGKLVADLDSQGLAWDRDCLSQYLPLLSGHSRLQQILSSFDTQSSPMCYSFGSNYPGHYFVSTLEPNQDDKILVYFWSADAEIVCADAFHTKQLRGLKAPNGLFEIPTKFLKNRDMKEIKVSMKSGGVMLVHPRLPISAARGSSTAYGLSKLR